jgi:Mg-chelatase subunit ChlD
LKKFLYLLLSFIFLSTSHAQKLKKLGIEFESTSYNFGDIQMWENQPAIFQLTNYSKHPISILPLFSENDLEIVYPDQSIAPGEKVILKAIYYTSGTGSFSRKFPIYFSTSPEAYELKITGNIKSLSPTAYIQCPQAKPEHSKPKLELVGNISEISTEIPLSGSVVKVIPLSTKGNTIFYSDKNGNFGSKMPTGNYEVIVEHPNYKPHSSFFYLGQNTGYLKISLEPIEEVIIAVNPEPNKVPEKTSSLTIKESSLPIDMQATPPSKVAVSNVIPNKPISTFEEQNLASKEAQFERSLPNTTIEKVASYTPETTPDKPEETKTSNPVIPNEKKVALETTPSVELYKPDPNEVNKPISPVAPPPATQQYTVRVLDEKTLAPIEDAQVYVTPVLDKKQTQKIKSANGGFASFPLKKEDYKIIVNADNYISGEAKIKSGQEDGIIRIFLSPVSDLFETIYTAKKEAQEPKDILSQFSFGKTEFAFAAAKEEAKEPVKDTPASNSNESIYWLDAKLEDAVSSLPKINNERLTPVQNSTPVPPEKETLDMDSIQGLYVNIQAEKEAMKLALEEAETKLNQQNELLALKEQEIQSKKAALSTKAEELNQVKTQFSYTEKELEAKKEALENLEKKKAVIEVPKVENYELSKNEYAANNVLFLIDVSSSMGKENKMELLKESIKSLTLVLRDIDRVAIIAYNQKTSVILESVSGDNKSLILKSIDSLQTSGLTYGVNGLTTAYELLKYYYIGDGNNQIILATDGLFSSANTTMSENELNKEVRQQATNNGIKLSVIGFGQDEEGQKLMQKLANNGEGQFIQIKNPWEARTVLVEEIKLNSKL